MSLGRLGPGAVGLHGLIRFGLVVGDGLGGRHDLDHLRRAPLTGAQHLLPDDADGFDDGVDGLAEGIADPITERSVRLLGEVVEAV